MTTTTATTPLGLARPRATLDGALWIAQTVVAFAFFFVGAARSMVPLSLLDVGWARTLGLAGWFHAIGVLELVLALGVLVPAVVRFGPRIAPISALFLALFACAGGAAHLVLGEPWRALGSLVLVALSLFVAWGRFFAAPIAAQHLDDEDPSQCPYPALSEAPQTWVG